MSTHRTIVVTGATGSVGGQVVAQLAGSGHEVRAVARRADALGELHHRHGAEPHVADLTEPATLAPALDGADAVFLVFPSLQADAVAADLVETLAAGGRRIVYLSAYTGPDGPDERAGGVAGSHGRVERLVRTRAREWTFLRAGGFATNTLGWSEQIRAGAGDGAAELRWFGPGVTRSLVHEADLAAVAVRALLDDGHHGRAYHLTGPEALTQVQQAARIGEALGRPVRFVDVGPEHAADLLVGVPPEYAREIVSAQLAMEAHPETVTTEVERLTGRPARTYARWARDHVEDFR